MPNLSERGDALFGAVGLAFLMVGNGLLGSLLGSLTIPRRLVTVGHIRVFAGLASLAAATALSYALLPAPLTWGVLRYVFGSCMSGLYVTTVRPLPPRCRRNAQALVSERIRFA